MNYSETTAYIVKDFERKPEALTYGGDDPETRFRNIIGVVSIIAPNFIYPDGFPTPGQMAQALSDWHSELATEVSSRYSLLTTELPNGSGLSREEANSDSELRMLQGIRRGVKLAMNSKYRSAQRVSARRPIRFIKQPGYFTELSDD